ncbi:MAG TPA: rod shape-determining protein MreD [bacterium]|nr:rod shape-determining protein MreD [bacterium]
MRNEVSLILMMLSSLLLALLLELLPLPHALNAWRAPWLLVTVVFWSLQLPAVAGIGTAWIAGLFLDAASAAPLGTHALIFTLASALSLALRRLLLTLSVFQQAIWMAALSVAQYGILLLLLPSAGTSGLLQTALSAALFWIALHAVLYPWVRPRLRAG